MDFGKELCEALRAKGFWADYIDPCSGLPVCRIDRPLIIIYDNNSVFGHQMLTGGTKVYSEVEGMQVIP